MRGTQFSHSGTRAAYPTTQPPVLAGIAALVLTLGCGGSPTSRSPHENEGPPSGRRNDAVSDRGANHEGVEARNPNRTPDPSLTSHERMLAVLNHIRAQTPDQNAYLGDAMARQLRQRLAQASSDIPEVNRWGIAHELAGHDLRLGNEHEAINALKKCYRAIPNIVDRLPFEKNEMESQVSFRLGVAYMRLGETENCCAQNRPESCILPIRGEGIHSRPEGSQKAIECFTHVLAKTATKDPLYQKALWLLNVAYMTIGGHPQNVPSKYLIPVSAFQSEETFPRFVNIAQRLGVDTFSMCGGAIGDDLDGDGYVDLVASSWNPDGQLRVFRNQQDGTFVDQTREAGIEGFPGGLNLLQADYDNDGHVDILVLRGAWLKGAGQHPNSLLRNQGDGTFTDVTFDAGLGRNHYPSQTAAWADYDNDGDVDLYIGNETGRGFFAPCQLFRNRGDGTFEDVASKAGVTNHRFSKAVVWGDYDGDRYPDLYVSNLGGPNRLYHNNQDGTFTDVAVELAVHDPQASFPAWFWDFNNDGHLDLFVSSYTASIGDVAAGYLGEPTLSEKSCLYRGDGKGRFVEVAQEVGLARPDATMGSNFGDLDNDGFLDFYLGTGYPEYENLMPSLMYRNRNGERFVDITTAGGFGHLQKGHAVVFADFDHDGDQDVFEQMGGAYPGDRFHDAFYQNPGLGNHWITIRLIGVHSNRSAIGARIRVDLVEVGKPRTVYKHVNSGGSFGANPLRQTVGLGQAREIAKLEVFWPATGKTQVFDGVAVDQLIEIVEGEAGYKRMELKRFEFAGP